MKALAIAATMTLLAPTGTAAARDGMPQILPAGFVYLRDVDASIAQDMRYASSDNFTGRRLPGYDAAECVLRREAAQALARVQADLASRQLSLKVYDCYRPQRAVAAMVRWARDGKDDSASKRFYPALDKRTLLSGYISAQSKHATGRAVDLTLVKLPATPAAAFDPAARYGACSGPAARRAPDNALDMGTGFDCFDPKSSAFWSMITAEQNHGRVVLQEAMARRGFRNYVREWWHFTFRAAPGPARDFPIGPRPSSTSP